MVEAFSLLNLYTRTWENTFIDFRKRLEECETYSLTGRFSQWKVISFDQRMRNLLRVCGLAAQINQCKPISYMTRQSEVKVRH